MIYSGKTDIGKRRRDNQDSFAISEAEGAVILTVCDGMGGAAGGSTASSSAVKTFNAYVTENIKEDSDIPALLCEGAAAANECVYNLAEKDDSLSGMGTTLVAAVVCIPPVPENEEAESGCADNPECPAAHEECPADTAECAEKEETAPLSISDAILDDTAETAESKAAANTDTRIYGVNIGDSRLYTVTKCGLKQISHDHSFVQYLVDIGQLTPEEAENNPNRNMITRAVGTGKEVEADTFTVDITGEEELWLLLCSDGLTNYLAKDKIVSIITDGEMTADEKTDALVKGANEGGGGDNITAVIAKCR